MEDFAEELGNAHVDEGVLVFVGKIDVSDFYDHAGCKVCKVTVPAGNRCGIFDYTVGAGSLIEMKLLRDIEFEITEDGEFSLHKDGDQGYSIAETYGVTREFWGDQLQLQFRPHNENADRNNTEENTGDSETSPHTGCAHDVAPDVSPAGEERERQLEDSGSVPHRRGGDPS